MREGYIQSIPISSTYDVVIQLISLVGISEEFAIRLCCEQ